MVHRIQTIPWNKMKPKHTTIQEWLQSLIELKTHGLVRTGTLIKMAVLSYLHGPNPLIKRCSHVKWKSQTYNRANSIVMSIVIEQ
jgi:hypothetical protein